MSLRLGKEDSSCLMFRLIRRIALESHIIPAFFLKLYVIFFDMHKSIVFFCRPYVQNILLLIDMFVLFFSFRFNVPLYIRRPSN